MAEPKTLFVSDLDGTLLRGDARISEQSLSILTELIGRGMCFTFATARSIVSAEPAVRGFALRIPVILHNGVFIFDMHRREIIHANFFTQDMIYKAKDILTAHGVFPLVYTHDAAGEHVTWLAGRETTGIRAYIDSRGSDRRLRQSDTLDALYQGNVYYVTCIGAAKEMQPVRSVFEGDPAYKCYYGKDLYSDDIWFELTPAQATKASAILWLKEKYGFERIVSFGDAVNDIPMFSISDECYAVENASEELKALATGIIPSNEEDGVAHWLWEHFRGIK